MNVIGNATAPAWGAENAKRVNDGSASGQARCEAEFGAKITIASDAERNAWAAALPRVSRELKSSRPG